MSAHATYSPSGASRWMSCPGSTAACAGLPDTSSAYADEGTAAHELASWVLAGDDVTACEFIGSEIEVLNDDGSVRARHVVDANMASFVQTYVDNVRDYATTGQLFVERRVDLSDILGMPDQGGTADAIVLSPGGTEIQVHDLKFGRGVEVSAQGNKQMMLYALGALAEFDALGDIETALLVIHQPRITAAPSEWVVSVEDLMKFRDKARAAVAAAEAPDAERVPSEDACRWCKVSGNCAAQTNAALSIIADDFVDVSKPIAAAIEHRMPAEDVPPDVVGRLLDAAGFVEQWLAAVRARGEALLFAGVKVPGWKLVEGRAGRRTWADEDEAERALKSMRLKHDAMYQYKVISPTAAEELVKAGAIGPRQWPKLQPLITRADGKPSVAPESDRRPALVITPAIDDFEDVSGAADPAPGDDASDLF